MGEKKHTNLGGQGKEVWIWEKWKEGGNRVKNSIYEILKEEQQQNKKKKERKESLSQVVDYFAVE